MNRLLTFVVLTLVLPASLVGQTPQERIEAARNRVTQQGLPVGPLDDRINEGRAKGVPLDRIADAVERRAAALEGAGAALRSSGAATPTAELAAGADAIEAGIPLEALRAVVADARFEDRPVAIAVLTYLHREQGLPVETALERVRQAMARGPDALRDLPAQAAAGRGRQSPPARPDPLRRPESGPPANVPGPGQRPGAGRPDRGGPSASPPGRPDRG
jgi:hypothetical protein